MATWIVHLRIAENFLRFVPDRSTGSQERLEPAAFSVGNIAPDSGIPDEKWEKFDPPPWVTHFGLQGSPQHKLADLEFYRRYLLPLRRAPDPGPVSFRLGYFFHLVIDNLWSTQIGLPTKQRFAAEFAADKNFIWEVKKDWYGLDFLYVHSHPDSLFWRVFLHARAETGGLDFLPLEAVRQRVAYIQEYYQSTGKELQNAYNRPYIYLPQSEMDRFVDEASARLSRIYQYLWTEGVSTDGFVSALDLNL
jgi:hypothetical protein